MNTYNLVQGLVSQIALAQTEGASAASDPLGGLGGLLPLVLMFGVIWLLLIRPANKQRKQHQQLLTALKKDDEVMTSGGMWGRIIGLDEKIVTLEIADKVKIKILRDRISGRWNPAAASATQK